MVDLPYDSIIQSNPTLVNLTITFYLVPYQPIHNYIHHPYKETIIIIVIIIIVIIIIRVESNRSVNRLIEPTG